MNNRSKKFEVCHYTPVFCVVIYQAILDPRFIPGGELSRPPYYLINSLLYKRQIFVEY